MQISIISLCLGSLFIGDLDVLRKQYLTAAMDKAKVQTLADSCETLNDTEDSTTQGYCTMVHFLEAKSAFNPYRKLSAFNAGRKKLDSLIVKNKTNIELRYLRHSIQERVPGFLGYNENLEEDVLFMQTNLSSMVDSAAYQLIYNYLEHRKK